MKFVFFASLVFFAASFIFAAESPRRTLGSSREISRAKTGGPKGGEFSKNFRLSFSAAVKKYVERSLDAKDKLFHFWDDEFEEEWTLALIEVRDEELKAAGHDRYFAPVDFVQKDLTGEGEDTPFVLDVFALRTAEGWEIEDIYIRSINDRVRYKFDEHFNRVSPDKPDGQAD